MARHSESSDSMRVVVFDLEQIGTCLGILNTEWTRLDDRRAQETPGLQSRTIKRQEHIEGIMAVLRHSSSKETHGETGHQTTS